MSEVQLSDFVDSASCKDPNYNPEWWHPERPRKNNPVRDYSYTIEGLRAKTICLNCPVFDTCLDYALSYEDLEGIWANYDYYERAEIAKSRGIIPTRSVLSKFADLIRKPVEPTEEW